MTKAFNNHAVIITGASRGIGREIALQLAGQGALLTLAARNRDMLSETAALCRERGGKAIAITLDVAEESQCKALIESSVSEYGRIDTLVNNAGVYQKSRLDELKTLSPMENLMQINFWGNVYCTFYALEYLKKTKGRIVVINSTAGILPSLLAPFYTASKHALSGFYDSLRFQLAGSGVTITSVYPYYVATGISARAIGPDGEMIGTVDRHDQTSYSAADCAKAVLNAAIRRKSDVITAPKVRAAHILRPVFPKFINYMSRKDTEL